MSALNKEWTNEEIQELDREMKAARAQILSKHGFTEEEIKAVLDCSHSEIRWMLER